MTVIVITRNDLPIHALTGEDPIAAIEDFFGEIELIEGNIFESLGEQFRYHVLHVDY